MHLGFTGTHKGMERRQRQSVMKFLQDKDSPFISYLHHGDCVGADEEMHMICHHLWPGLCFIGHIPEKEDMRAFCTFDEERDPLPYMKRNRAIIEESDHLLACPPTFNWISHSGTWMTIELVKKSIPITIIYPNGVREDED